MILRLGGLNQVLQRPPKFTQPACIDCAQHCREALLARIVEACHDYRALLREKGPDHSPIDRVFRAEHRIAPSRRSARIVPEEEQHTQLWNCQSRYYCRAIRDVSRELAARTNS